MATLVGTQKRRCVLGAKDGEWQKTSGYCMPMMVFMLILVVGICFVVEAVIVVMTVIRYVKTTGGMKDRNKKTMKKVAPKKTTKSAKV